MKIDEINFLEYLSKEEQNLLTSFNNFRNEFDLFYNIDRIYQEPLRTLVVSEDEAIIPQLYLYVHFHLYFSISTLLRSHLSECLASMRKAIDAALSAYKITLEPDYYEKYINRDKYFLFIKRNIQNEIRKDSSKYPLAHDLLKLHDANSEYGSHADISSFFHRFEIRKLQETNQDQFLLHYFQFPRNQEEYRFYYIVTLQAFYLMFLIFKFFLDKKLKIIDQRWESTIASLGPTLDKLRKETYSKFGENP